MNASDERSALMMGTEQLAVWRGDAPNAKRAFEDCRNRLQLLLTATEHADRLDASLVQTVVQDILMDFRGLLEDFVDFSAKVSEHTESLPMSPLSPEGCTLQTVPKLKPTLVG